MSILRARNKRPSIDFGLGVLSKKIALGETITIYQNTTYLESEYVVNIDLSELPSERFNNNKFSVVGNVEGTHQIRVDVSNMSKSIEMKSNIITLIVE